MANRRQFLHRLSAGTASLLLLRPPAGAAHPAAPSFFTLTRRDGRAFFLAPDGRPFFSLGLNHVDPATLRQPEAGNLWTSKYHNDMRTWLQSAVRPDLLAWGFNTLGWNQEVVIRHDGLHRHSPSFTYEEYQWLDLPYCHLLNFSNIHQWEDESRLPDFFSPAFAEWCDYVARADCARLRDDPKLIGYFYSDCPVWVHTRPGNAWRGSLFDPALLATDTGRQELHRLATRYYTVTRDAIRRYDPYHLILGDRYEANQRLPDEVLLAACPFVDVLSFQHFGPPAKVAEDLARFATLTAKPVLLADHAGIDRGTNGAPPRVNPEKYALMLALLRALPACVGFHLCGAYLRNTARNRGLRGPDETPDTRALDGITAANQATHAWMENFTGS